MRFLLLVMMVVVLAGPTHAQAQDTPHVNLLGDGPQKTPEEKEADEARDKAYRDTLKKIPDAKAASDPWGGVRGNEAPKAVAKTQAPPKPKTRTGNNAN